jgi:outer membrane protein OmpA-like peptidoglycan-associated protein
MKIFNNKKRNIHMACATALLFAPSMAFADNNVIIPTDLAGKYYTEYEQREPCQYYKTMPQSLAGTDRCVSIEEGNITTGGAIQLLPVVATYTIYFDFDKSNIRADQAQVINKLVNELNTYAPTQVTVVGHTDTSGDDAYNKTLSSKRADTVSKALATRNIANFYLDEHAVGEENLAIPTPDGTRLEQNRRVVIQFRR